MDNAFQELDYSDISAKNLNKKNRSNDLNTKTRGGIIRLGSLIIITIIVLILIITLISKSKTLSTKEAEIGKIKEEITTTEQDKTLAEEKNRFLIHEIYEAQKSAEQLNQQKSEIETNIQNLENLKKKSQNDIKNAQESITMLEAKLKEFEEKKAKVNELQKNVDYYQSEIEKLKNKDK